MALLLVTASSSEHWGNSRLHAVCCERDRWPLGAVLKARTITTNQKLMAYSSNNPSRPRVAAI